MAVQRELSAKAPPLTTGDEEFRSKFISWNLADLTYVDIREYLKQKDSILVPMASTEQHGPHLPLATDTITAVEVAARQLHEGVVASLADGARVVGGPVGLHHRGQRRLLVVDGVLPVAYDLAQAGRVQVRRASTNTASSSPADRSRLSLLAARVMTRTWSKVSRPPRNAAATVGRCGSRRAAVTYAEAAPGASLQVLRSHATSDGAPESAQLRSRSSSPTASTISASSRSRSASSACTRSVAGSRSTSSIAVTRHLLSRHVLTRRERVFDFYHCTARCCCAQALVHPCGQMLDSTWGVQLQNRERGADQLGRGNSDNAL